MDAAQAASSDKEPKLWKEELRRAWRELRGAELSPARAAAAVALGLFIGSIPIFGCHTPLVLTICILLQLDALLAWVCSHISNPFFAPFLMTGEVWVGSYIRTGEPVYITPAFYKEQGLGALLTDAFIGAPAVAAGLAVIGAIVVYLIVLIKQKYRPAEKRDPYRLPENAPPWWHMTERVASRYSPLPEVSTPAQRTRFHYVRVKLMTDPVSKMIADLFGTEGHVLGDVLDIGCGRGQMPVVLLELGRAASAQGFDWDEGKIAAAREAAAVDPALDASFDVGDAKEDRTYDDADTVMLIDVIHYLTLEEQDALLARAAEAVRPGGRLVVREADTKRGWRSWATLLEEKVFTFLRFNRGARVKFRASQSIVDQLEKAGLVCEVKPAWGGTPFSNVLIIGRREAA